MAGDLLEAESGVTAVRASAAAAAAADSLMYSVDLVDWPLKVGKGGGKGGGKAAWAVVKAEDVSPRRRGPALAGVLAPNAALAAGAAAGALATAGGDAEGRTSHWTTRLYKSSRM